MNCLEQIELLEKGIQYINETLKCEDLQAWEIKEYIQVKQNNIEELESLKLHVAKYPELFN